MIFFFLNYDIRTISGVGFVLRDRVETTVARPGTPVAVASGVHNHAAGGCLGDPTWRVFRKVITDGGVIQVRRGNRYFIFRVQSSARENVHRARRRPCQLKPRDRSGTLQNTS